MGGSLGLREWWVGGGVVGVCVGWCGGVKGGGAGCTGMWDGGAPCERIEAKGTQTGMTTVFFAPPPRVSQSGQSLNLSIGQSISHGVSSQSPPHPPTSQLSFHGFPGYSAEYCLGGQGRVGYGCGWSGV